jgi:hypothetical protein
VRQMMANRSTWTGSASDLLRAGAALAGPGLPSGAAAWLKSPRELAVRLRRAQTFLRALGIHIAFGREGRAGTRVIRICTRPENTVSTVSIILTIVILGRANCRPSVRCSPRRQPSTREHGRRRC